MKLRTLYTICLHPPSARSDALANLLRDLHGNDVVAVDVLVVQPSVGRAHEVLVLDVDEPLGLADGRRVGAGNRVVHGTALLRCEGSLVLQLKSGKLKAKRPK